MNTLHLRPLLIQHMTARLLGVCMLAALCLSVAACNTTKGAGKDVQELGKSVEESAEKHGAD